MRDPSGLEKSRFHKPNRNNCFPQQLEEDSGKIFFFNDPSGVKPLDKVMKNELENMDQTTGVPIVETQIGKGLGVV